MAQRFDANELQLTGEPFPVAERVAYNPGLGRGAFSVSENGVLVYRTGSGQINQPFWFDREGKQIGSLGVAGLYFTLWLSPDQRRAALDRVDSQTGTNDMSSDGQFIVYRTLNQKTKLDLWVLPMSGDRQPFPFLQTEFNEQQAQFSPDGKWIVYTSEESGAPEVYAQTFPASAGRWRVSTDGGSQPKWRRDGRELFYIAADRKLMAVDVKLGATFEVGVPKTLFSTRVLSLTDFRHHYAVTADGQRFLINSTLEETDATPISVVVNWAADLKR